MDTDSLRSEILRLHRLGIGRQKIASYLHTSRPLVRAVIDEQGQPDCERPFAWLPADDDANLKGSKTNYLPTPDEIRRECLAIRAKNGHLRPEETEELRA